jgi:hypothetical protein
MSKLKKKLSGERISDRDPVDDIMDKYLRPDYERRPEVYKVDHRNEPKTAPTGGSPKLHRLRRK